MTIDRRTVALAAARAIGCTCDPEIELSQVEPGVWSVEVRHEDACPLLRALEEGEELG